MLTAFNKKGETVVAFEATRFEGPFICTYCKNEVILKKGDKKIHHFAHTSKSECPHENESPEHMLIKTEIYKSLKKESNVKNCELEKSFGDNRPDLYAEINGTPVAIEIQLSHLSVEKIEERTLKYKEKGIYVLWVTSYNKFLERIDFQKNKEINIKVWEKWLHTMYIGQIFLWKKESTLIPVKLYPVSKKNGYNSSVRRRPVSRKPVRIEKDFFPVNKKQWQKYPAALIFNTHDNPSNHKNDGGLMISNHGEKTVNVDEKRNISLFERFINFLVGGKK